MRNATTYRVLLRHRFGERWNNSLIMTILSLVTVGALLYVFYTLASAAIPWTEVKLDDLRYGYPRTYQADGALIARPMAAEAAHVIVLNLQGRLWLVVLPEGARQRVAVIKGPQLLGPGRDLVPATVMLRDINNSGRTDLVVHAGGRTFVYLQDAHQRGFALRRTSIGAIRRQGSAIAPLAPSTQTIPSGAGYPHILARIGDYRVRGKPTITPDLINQVLATYRSPLAGQGQALYDLGVKYGIDPAFCLAFFVQESAAGTRGEATLTHSVGNLRPEPGMPSLDGYRYYDTWLEGAEDWYRLIRNVYIDQWGLSTVDTIVPVYAPSGDNNDVAVYVQNVEQLVGTWREQSTTSP